ncbi:MAG: hypothetical protein M0021_13280 [Clostridia bacterium]|nr:hypothetical protein [Clostridia bacterium]
MVLGYWDTHGYTNLQSDSDRVYGTQLQNELYSDMGTSSIGTSLVGWTSGVRTHANSHSGYNFSSGYTDKNAPYSTAWYFVTSEINSSRPFGFYVGWDNGQAGDLYYDYHFVKNNLSVLNLGCIYSVFWVIIKNVFSLTSVYPKLAMGGYIKARRMTLYYAQLRVKQ